MLNQENAEVAEKMVSELLNKMGFTANIFSEVKGEEDKQFIFVKIEGENLSDLIGFHGKYLNSLQHIINLAYNKDKEVRERIIIDINGYRQKREDYLKSLAERVLVDVKLSGQSVALQPMKPAERRIIHLALQEEEGITTHSEGEEPNRYVVVKPE